MRRARFGSRRAKPRAFPLVRQAMATRRLLEGQRAVVTGASSGIGAAIACALGEAGASVIVNYHSDEQGAQATVATIAAAGGKAVAVQADVSRAEDCARLFDAADAQLGGVDIAILNAGIQADAAFTEMTLAQWHQVIGTNLTGQFLCAGRGAAVPQAGDR